jgi:hypothetical protein
MTDSWVCIVLQHILCRASPPSWRSSVGDLSKATPSAPWGAAAASSILAPRPSDAAKAQRGRPDTSTGNARLSMELSCWWSVTYEVAPDVADWVGSEIEFSPSWQDRKSSRGGVQQRVLPGL